MTDDELDALLAALPYFDPRPGLSDRVIARVGVLQQRKRRRSLAAAAVLAAVIAGAMAASAIWSLGHQALMASLGRWLVTEARAWAWYGAQSGYALVRSLPASPTLLAIIWAVASVTFLGGLVALRRLLALPTGQVAHVRG